MLQKILHRFLLRRHFWRHATFSEIAELYASRVLRMAALHMAGAFISIYLYKEGYSVAFIALFWTIFYGYKVFISLPSAALIARIGPKHGVFISNLLYIPAMIGFALLPSLGPWVLVAVILFEGLSTSLYSIGHTVDFSKVKNSEHVGKEIAFMNIIEKITIGLTPLIGGGIALLWGPQVVIIVAAFLFLLAAVPLLLSDEPTQRMQKLHFKGFPWHLLRRHVIGQFAYGFDVFTSGNAWTIFLGAVILSASQGNEIYMVTGIVLSVVIFVSLIASYAYGKLIDNKQGKELMQLSAIANATIHLTRPFVNSPYAVAGLNAVNEAATTGYLMPYTRAVFDNADLSGHRITYIGLTELVANLGAACGGLALTFLALAFSEPSALRYLFIIAAGVALLMLTARFPLYRR